MYIYISIISTLTWYVISLVVIYKTRILMLAFYVDCKTALASDLYCYASLIAANSRRSVCRMVLDVYSVSQTKGPLCLRL